MRIKEISNDKKRREFLESSENWKEIMRSGPIKVLEFNRYGLHMIRIQVLNREWNHPSGLTTEWRNVSCEPFQVENGGAIGRRISRTDQLAVLRRAAKVND